MGRDVVLAERPVAVDQHEIIRLRHLRGGKRGAGIEQRQRLFARDAVRAQAVDRLELDDGVLCAGAEVAVGRAGEVAQRDERVHAAQLQAVDELAEKVILSGV